MRRLLTTTRATLLPGVAAARWSVLRPLRSKPKEPVGSSPRIREIASLDGWAKHLKYEGPPSQSVAAVPILLRLDRPLVGFWQQHSGPGRGLRQRTSRRSMWHQPSESGGPSASPRPAMPWISRPVCSPWRIRARLPVR